MAVHSETFKKDDSLVKASTWFARSPLLAALFALLVAAAPL